MQLTTCTSLQCGNYNCAYCLKCSHAIYMGSGIDKHGVAWRWEFNPRFGPLFVTKKGEPLKHQPIEETHPAWTPFETWHEVFKTAQDRK